MNYWLFTVTQKKTDKGMLSAETIFERRLADNFWGIGERTPNRRYLQPGDRIVFYVGIPTVTFAATATISTECFSLTQEQKDQYCHGESTYDTDLGVFLEDIRVFDPPKPVKEIIPALKFIENKESWGAYFQGGVRQLSEDDYSTIINYRKTDQPGHSITEDEIISESQFALEAHLEEFMDKNWAHIHFDSKLAKYEIDEQSGRQFPAGPWSIDFLCIDKKTGDLVVIELKRGKTSDAAVGQVLRYIGWVSENLAKPEQNVRGIIIAQDVDDALRYAVKGLPNVSVMTYRVDFQLLPFKG